MTLKQFLLSLAHDPELAAWFQGDPDAVLAHAGIEGTDDLRLCRDADALEGLFVYKHAYDDFPLP